MDDGLMWTGRSLNLSPFLKLPKKNPRSERRRVKIFLQQNRKRKSRLLQWKSEAQALAPQASE
jgi:hypothetical protein